MTIEPFHRQLPEINLDMSNTHAEHAGWINLAVWAPIAFLAALLIVSIAHQGVENCRATIAAHQEQ